MTTPTAPQQETHWRDRLIERSEVISDTFEVTKAYGARFAEWVLYGCLFANILEMFPLPFPFWFGDAVLAVQAITLDVAGFGLTTMGDHARRQGNEKAANTARTMGWTLISLMILTVGLVTLSILIPSTKPFVDGTEKALILARVIVTVLYGHVVHSLRQASVEYSNQMFSLKQEVSTLRQTASTLQPQLDSAKKQVDALTGQLQEKEQMVDTLSFQLDAEQQKTSSLQNELNAEHSDASTVRKQLNEVQAEMEGLHTQLNGKKLELANLREMMESGQEWQESRGRQMLEAEQQRVASLQQQLTNEQSDVSALRRQLGTTMADVDGLRAQVTAKQQEIEGVRGTLEGEQQVVSTLRTQLETEQRRVSTLRQRLENGQPSKVSTQVKVDTGHEKAVSSGQAKVVQLDTTRHRKNGQDAAENAIEEQIRALLVAEPGLSGRAIATRISCSPTTANRWKAIIEQEQDEQPVVVGE